MQAILQTILATLICIGLAAGSTALTAQPLGQSSAKDWSLPYALEQALRYHPSVAGQQGLVRSALADLEAAEWSRYPSLSAESSRSGAGDRQTVARLQQPLWTGGRISSQIELAQTRVIAAEAGLQETRLNVLTETASSYVEFWRARQRLMAADANVAEHQRLYALMERRTASEISPRVDLVLARARLQSAQNERTQISSGLAAARNRLQQWVGQAIEGTQAPETLPRLKHDALEDVLHAAINFSPEIRRLQAEREQAKAQVDLARAQMMPTVSLTHDQRLGGSGPADKSQTFIALQFQPGAGLSARAQMASAIERVEVAQQAIEAARLKNTQNVETLWNELQSWTAQNDTTEGLVQSTQGVIESYTRQYTAGRKSWIDVMNAQRELVQSLYTQADVQAYRWLTTVRLQLLTGTLDAHPVNPAIGR